MDEQSSIIGLSTKNQPTDQQIAQWEATGLSVYNQNETILISANAPSDDLAPKTTFRLGLLLPFNDASILFRESGTRTSIRITNRGITIIGQTGIQQQNPSIFAP